jgi:hypothetical protein
MTIAFAALHRTLRYGGESTDLYVVTFIDGTTFLSWRKPTFYDAAARRIAPREVVPGTNVNVRYERRLGVNWMQAIQLIREPPEDESPFDPVPDGHL